MERRNFIGLGLGLVAAAAIPSSLSAIDFRATKPAAWKAAKTDAAINDLYGKGATDSSDVKLKAPAIAENGGVIPISVETSLDAKSVSIYQDANPESLVAVFTVPQGGIVDYGLRIKMAKTGNVTVVVETRDGKLYSTSKEVKVTKGGCGGWSSHSLTD